MGNRDEAPRERSKLWLYELRTRIWVDIDLENIGNIGFVKRTLRAEKIPRRKLVEFFTNLYRDYPGTFLTPDENEAFLDMSVFEVPNIDTWLRDWPVEFKLIGRPRIRPEARERIKVLGTLFGAYKPIPGLYEAVRRATLEFKYSEDWEEAMQPARRS